MPIRGRAEAIEKLARQQQAGNQTVPNRVWLASQTKRMTMTASMSKTNSLLPEPNRAQTFIFSGELCLSPSLSSFSVSLFPFLSLCSICVCVCFHLFWVLIVKCRRQTRAYIAASFWCTLLWHPLHLFSPLSPLSFLPCWLALAIIVCSGNEFNCKLY